jgi:hypothetical protein
MTLGPERVKVCLFLIGEILLIISGESLVSLKNETFIIVGNLALVQGSLTERQGSVRLTSMS